MLKYRIPDRSIRMSLQNENGFVLVITMMVGLLTTLLLLLGLGVTNVELRSSYVGKQTTQGREASVSGIEFSARLIQAAVEDGLPAPPPADGICPASVVICFDPVNKDLLAEIQNITFGNTFATDKPLDRITTEGETLSATPDILLTALNDQTIRVDIDYEAEYTVTGSALEGGAERYSRTVLGAGCGTGSIYYIDSAAVGQKATSTVHGAYYSCPE